MAAKRRKEKATLIIWEATSHRTCAGTPRTPLCRLPRIITTTTDLRIRPDGITTTGITTTGTTTGVVALTVVEVETPAAAIVIITATREEKMKPTTTTTTKER